MLASVPLSPGSGSDYVYLPLLSAATLGLLTLMLRWIMRPGRRRAARVSDPSQGLLIGVAATTPAEAERLRRLLAEAGVRATSRAVASRRQVLVWPDDVDRALTLITAAREHRADRDRPDR